MGWAAKKRHADRRRSKAGQRRAKAYAKFQQTVREGIACPSCLEATEIRTHAAITPKLTRQPYYYARWYMCLNPTCATTMISRNEDRVWRSENNCERASIVQDLDDIMERIAAARRAGKTDPDADLMEAVHRVRLRVFAFARSLGRAEFVRIMQPHDFSGDNIVRFGRRRRW